MTDCETCSRYAARREERIKAEIEKQIPWGPAINARWRLHLDDVHARHTAGLSVEVTA